MKKIAAFASFAAFGAMSLPLAQAQSTYSLAPQLSQQELSKPWSISASLRGFYDDNWNTANKALNPQHSFGGEISPAFSLNLPMEQTYIGLNARYTGRYYENRANNSWENEFQFGAVLNHQFSERFKLEFNDSFVYSQNPDVINAPNTAFATPLRSNQNSKRNSANINFTFGLTPTVSLVLGYGNNWYSYQQKGNASLSALLDRVEHNVPLSVRWQVKPSTTLIAGYAYGRTDYLSSEFLDVAGTVAPKTRNSESHYGFLGVDHAFTETLSASVRGGAQYVMYPNAAANAAGSSVSPYVDASLNWSYRPSAYVALGVRHSRNATDVAFDPINNPITDQESTTVYLNVSHPITPKLTVSALAQAQFSSFNRVGGNIGENYYLAGLTFAYSINQFLSAEAGYNYDRLTSDLDSTSLRSYSRNRVFLGLRATY